MTLVMAFLLSIPLVVYGPVIGGLIFYGQEIYSFVRLKKSIRDLLKKFEEEGFEEKKKEAPIKKLVRFIKGGSMETDRVF